MVDIPRKRPKVSVIMNCLNCAKYLREAIDSIYAQTYKDWEIIFWDNASTDDSAVIAGNYDGRLRYFRDEEVVPLGKSRNLAMEKAGGEYIAFLDCDDKWMPEKLERQIPLFERNPLVGMVFSDAFDFFQYDGSSARHFLRHGFNPKRGKIFAHLLNEYSISMPTVVLRAKALYSQPEWFDERFHICTDYDLFLRIAYDWECDYVDEPLAVYRIHNASITERLHQNISKERALTIEKFYRLYPDIDSHYKKEIAKNKRIIAFQQGKSFWREGKIADARESFKKHLYSPKVLLAYIATVFPYNSVMQVLNAVNRLSRTRMPE